MNRSRKNKRAIRGRLGYNGAGSREPLGPFATDSAVARVPPMRIRLLNCLAGAVLKHGPKLLFSWAPGGEVLYEIAAETWTAFRKHDEPDAARLEVEALAQASAEQVRE